MAEEKKAAAKPAARKTAPRRTAAQKKSEAQAHTDAKKIESLEAKLRDIEAQAVEPAPVENTQKYIRNLYGSLVRVKFSRHTPAERGIILQPRGQRGDLSPVSAEDLNDPVFLDNQGSLFELVDGDQAREIVGKQTTNQQAIHPALSALRNEKNEEYEQKVVTVDESFEKQGVTVAQLEDGQVVVNSEGIQRRKRGEAPGTPDYIAGADVNHATAGEEASYLSDLRKSTQVDPPRQS
jgi:hypothetical protein